MTVEHNAGIEGKRKSAAHSEDWINSYFSATDLHGKTVECFFVGDSGQILAAQGILLATAVSDAMRVKIRYTDTLALNRSHSTAAEHIIPGQDASNLIKNAPGSKCDFSFLKA